jgi:uncharacterized protein with ACT and thioredoxin-like domain
LSPLRDHRLGLSTLAQAEHPLQAICHGDGVRAVAVLPAVEVVVVAGSLVKHRDERLAVG